MDTIISVDVETDGSIPGVSSLRQLGAVAFNMRGVELAAFCVNLKPLPTAKPDPDTMKWWAKQDPKVRAMIGKNPIDPKDAIEKFHTWVIQFPHPKLLAAPAAFDGSFVRWYTRYFGIVSNIYHAIIDLRTVCWILTGQFEGEYRDHIRQASCLELPVNPTPHYALSDAREQGILLFMLLAARVEDARSDMVPF